MEHGTFPIREATVVDIPLLDGIAGRKEQGYFERCFAEKRRIFAAGEAGYVQLNMRPNYEAFRRQNIPEVQDLIVLPEFRNRGIGRSLVAHCEAVVKAAGGGALGISVGLDHGFGAAQRLYVKMGYVPDGAGIAYDDMPVRRGEMRAVDDNLTLKMVKIL
jgi:GNAT superfamily N-acetyltransferase